MATFCANFDHFPFPVHPGDYQPILHIDNIGDYSAQDITPYPTKGMLPANVWSVGNTIREVIAMQLPVDLPASTYNLYISMYAPDTQMRLPVKIETGESNELMASQFEAFR